MLDSRLFNQEQLAGSFGDDDSYGLYDKPLFSGSSAAAAIYKPRGANIDDEGNEVALEEGISKSMQNDRFGLGVAGRGFEGADANEVRDGCVKGLLVSHALADLTDPADPLLSRRIHWILSESTPSSRRPSRELSVALMTARMTQHGSVLGISLL